MITISDPDPPEDKRIPSRLLIEAAFAYRCSYCERGDMIPDLMPTAAGVIAITPHAAYCPAVSGIFDPEPDIQRALEAAPALAQKPWKYEIRKVRKD